jgi:hypothetical protein
MARSPTFFRDGMVIMLMVMHLTGRTATEAIAAVLAYCPERQRFRGFSDFQQRCIASIKSNWKFNWQAPPIRRPRA